MEQLENQITALEEEIMEKKKKLSELRKQLIPEEVKNYVFTSRDGRQVSLEELFGDKNELMVIHNMGKKCNYCTLWADELNGIAHHIVTRVPLAVISPDAPDVMASYAGLRGWNFPIYSSSGNSFKKDVGFETDKGMVQPGVSVFLKKDGKMYHYSRAFFGPGDDFCGLWSYFDLLPEGSKGWHPYREN